MNPRSSRPRARTLLVVLFAVAGVAIVAGLALSRPRHTAPRAGAVTAPAAAPAPAPARDAGPKPPQVWAVAIGIDQYQDPAIPACHGAVGAARAVASWVAETAGWGAGNVLTMDELGQAEPPKDGRLPESLLPTRANLDWAFRHWLAGRVRPEDTVIVFFAGHAIGLPPLANAPAGSPGRDYLLPIDARSLQWDRSAWALDEAIDGVASSGRNTVLCWLDTSLLGRGRRVAAGPDFVPTATPMLQKLARWPGVTAWIAADEKPAVEAAAVGALSPFTSALLEALGTKERPSNVHACLDRLNHDPKLAAQGFRVLGGVDPGLNLWTSKVRQESLLKRELLLQRGHAGGVSALAFSADGSRLISGAQDSTVKVWSAFDRKLLRSLAYHTVGVTGLSLNARGDRLASGDGSGWLRVWDLIKQEEIPPPPPHERGVDQVAFLSDGARLVTLDMDGKAWLWNLDDPAGQVRPLSSRATGVAPASGPGPVVLAVAEADGKVALLAADEKPGSSMDGPGGVVTSRRLATDGRIVVMGDDRGQVVVWDAAATKERLRQQLPAAIDSVAISPRGVVALASGKNVLIVSSGYPAARPHSLELGDAANRVAFSADGRWLAACTASGNLRLWRVNEQDAPAAVPLEDVDKSGRSTTFAFSPDGRKLVSGDQDGGLRTWELPDGHQRPPVPARRGQVASLSVSGDGRYLLQVTQDRQAQVWDLKDGRGLSPIEGNWVAGALSADGQRAYLTSEAEGDVVAVDRADGRRLPVRFARPAGSRQRFGKLAISPDGRRVAAGSLEGPLACVWDAATGALLQAASGHVDPNPITAVAFSGDSKRWLTASEDGSVKVWDLDAKAGQPEPVANYTMTDAKTGEPVPVTAATLSPVDPRRVVAGAIDGQLLLWDGGEKPTDLGSLGRAVLAVAFTPDGRWLSAAGADKSVWLWESSRPRRRLRLEPVPQHAEQVNALVAWPDSRLFASGSDDTTIRLWNPAERSLLGTLSAEQGSTDWVAYTPDGLFDSSIGGEAQVTWFDNKSVLTLDQVYDEFHVFKLTDQLRRAIRPRAPAPPRRAPPALSINPPLRLVSDSRLAQLDIALGEAGLTGLRLYQNGVPVQAEADMAAGPDRRLKCAPIRLRHGLNRFHVMAGRPGSTDVEGRSQTVEIRYDGPDSPGQLHILALGVSQYDDRGHALQFADRDAEQLAGFLHRSGSRVAGTLGTRIVLTNREVTEEKVDEAFRQIRDRVKGRPEDTVAVFLAGHADTLDNRFYLLLPSFPFAENDPKTGRPKRGRTALDIAPENVLPYVAVYRNLARLGALQRVVMIDACQAEAIRDDPGVKVIQELIDTEAHRAKTAYLLAARRGEPAGEVAALAHGLMTYALLKGLGERNLETVPGLTVFEELPTADRNRDGVVTTDELRWYANLTVPRLAANFPQLVMRQGATAQSTPIRPTANLAQQPQVQATGASFPLVEIGTSAQSSEASPPAKAAK